MRKGRRCHDFTAVSTSTTAYSRCSYCTIHSSVTPCANLLHRTTSVNEWRHAVENEFRRWPVTTVGLASLIAMGIMWGWYGLTCGTAGWLIRLLTGFQWQIYGVMEFLLLSSRQKADTVDSAAIQWRSLDFRLEMHFLLSLLPFLLSHHTSPGSVKPVRQFVGAL